MHPKQVSPMDYCTFGFLKQAFESEHSETLEMDSGRLWEGIGKKLYCIDQELNATRCLTFFSDEQAIALSEIEFEKKIYSLLRLKEAYT